MASGFFALLDDIASLMDDVAVTSKVATQKTVGILGDDLAVNAEKATGFVSNRELPVLWSITKGSLINKAILIPIALLLNTFLPTAIEIILIFGGLYLAFEGAEKVIEYLFHNGGEHHADAKNLSDMSPEEEKIKVKSAIKTDFILSIEIVIISLGNVLNKSLPIQIITVSIVSIIATVGVYGIVALIVRMDDTGFMLVKLSKGKMGFLTKLGNFLVKLLPWVIKILGVVGTIALLLVSGSLLGHHIPFLHSFLEAIPAMVKDFLLGLFAGALLYGLIQLFKLVKAKLIKTK